MTHGELDPWLSDAVRDAKAAWPGVAVSEAEFVDYLRAKVAALGDVSFRQLRTNDLFLAFACAKGDASALALFERHHLALVDRTLERMRLSASAAEEYRASLLECLFFPRDGAAPLIASYGGRGDLASWLRSIATRAGVKLRGREERNVDAAGALDLLPAEGDPELAYLRSRYARELEGALSKALEGLSPRERNLLRQHYRDGLSLDAVARLYRVHRATAARWLADVRQAVLVRVRDSLRAGGALSDSELDSIVRMARSGFDLGISTLLHP